MSSYSIDRTGGLLAVIAYIRAFQINKKKPPEVPADYIQVSGGQGLK